MNAPRIHAPALPLARPLSRISLLLALTFVAASPGIAAPSEETPAVETSGLPGPITANLAATAHFQASPLTQSAQLDFAPDSGLVSIKTFLDKSAFPWLPSAHPDDFVVYENGVRQQNVDVTVEHVPMSIGILLEYGGRYHTLNEIRGEKAWTAAKDLLQEIGPDDKMALWKYADSVELVSDWTSSADSGARTQFSSPPPSLSELNLYDAVIKTLPKMQSMPGRKVLVLISSGVDTFSKASFADALAEARTAGIPIYVVNLGPTLRSALFLDSSAKGGPYDDLNWKRAQTELERLAHASGGGIFSPESSLDLSGVYDDLLAKLRVRYTFQYKARSAASDGRPRTVRVQLLGPMSGVVASKKEPNARLIAEMQYVPSHVSASITDRTQAPAASVASR
jgi:Ca-activated chloride channel family protein